MHITFVFLIILSPHIHFCGLLVASLRKICKANLGLALKTMAGAASAATASAATGFGNLVKAEGSNITHKFITINRNRFNRS